MEDDDLTLPGDLPTEGEPAEGLTPDLGAGTDMDLGADLASDGGLPDLGGDVGLETDAVDLTLDAGGDDLSMDALSPDLGGDALAPDLGGDALVPDLGGDALAPDLGGDALAPDLGGDALSPDLGVGGAMPDMMAEPLDLSDGAPASMSPDIGMAAAPIAAAPAAAAAGGMSGLAEDSIVNIGAIHSIKVSVQAVLGGVSLPISKLMSLKKDDVVALDSKVGSAIDLLANGQLIARGEIVVLEEEDEPRFGITLTEIVTGVKDVK